MPTPVSVFARLAERLGGVDPWDEAAVVRWFREDLPRLSPQQIETCLQELLAADGAADEGLKRRARRERFPLPRLRDAPPSPLPWTVRLWARFFAALLCVFALGCGPEETPSPAAAAAHYVETGKCHACHRAEHQAWTGSHHDLAMQPATAETVLGDFDDVEFERYGVTTRFFRDGDRFKVRTDGPDGELHDYDVLYTFGIDPLQQYLLDVGNGHIQALNVCWDVHEKRWFHLYDEHIAHDDPLHWTGAYQNWNYMCAECHTTNLRRNYDLETGSYVTKWSEGDVSCQACHGPGSEHVAWAERVKRAGNVYDEDEPKGLVVDLKAEDSRVQIETCARCHARRNIVSGEFGHGDPLLDHYDPELLVSPLYHADGQILDEVYVYGSFLQAKKYHAGVRCTDCHDPHTARTRRDGNALCTECHREDPPERFPTLKAKAYDTRSHHHHTPGSAGALCVDCHMPATVYMQVDPRRDHSFRIPRPDRTGALGTPDACTSCHDDRDAGWAAARLDEWFPASKPEGPVLADLFAAARRSDERVVPDLLEATADPEVPAILRATSLRELRRFVSRPVLEAAAARLDDEEALVRLAAVDLLGDTVGPDQAEWKIRVLAPRLEDDVRAVRGEAARALAGERDRIPAEHRPAFDAALAEFVARQESLVDRADSHLNLGALYEALGDVARAEAAYETALKVNPDFIPVRFNLATLRNRQGRNEDAEQLLREILALMPEHGEGHYSLGLLLAEMERFGDAASSLARAAALLPGRPRIHYNRALVLQRIGQNPEAEKALLQAHELEPRDPRVVHALALYYLERRNRKEAMRFAEKLVELVPQDPGARQLLEHARAR